MIEETLSKVLILKLAQNFLKLKCQLMATTQNLKSLNQNWIAKKLEKRYLMMKAITACYHSK